jgi:plastocyanin
MKKPKLILATVAALACVVALPAAQAKPKPPPKPVKVADDFYSPTKVTIPANGKVTWTWQNTNSDSHNVTLTKGQKGVKKSDYKSNTASTHFRYTAKFVNPGTYQFHCTIHPTLMKMKVVVQK